VPTGGMEEGAYGREPLPPATGKRGQRTQL